MKMSLTPLEFHELMREAPQHVIEAAKPIVSAEHIYMSIMLAQGVDEESTVPFDLHTREVRQHYKNIALQLNKRLQAA